jgi:hypothetical protein
MTCIKKLRCQRSLSYEDCSGLGCDMNDERIPKKALQQITYGKRAVGKPGGDGRMQYKGLC